MISTKNYLKDFQGMDDTEKKDYLSRVEKWTSETFPELLALADCWQHVPVKDFDEGCRLVSAITNAKPFLRDIQRYEASRALKKMNLFLADVRKKSGLSKQATRGPIGIEHFRAIVEDEGIPQEDGTLQRKEYKEEELDGLRPKDFVLYKDRLPKDLREKGEKQIGGMYLELSEYRGRLEAMVEHPNVTDAARADMAEKVLKTEQKIREFWAEVDSFLAGNIQKQEAASDPIAEMKRPGEYTREEIEAMSDPQRQDICRKARIDLNKKYIRRNDVNVTDEYKEELKLRIQELIEWGESLPKKTAEVLNNIGIAIPGINVSVQEESGNEKGRHDRPFESTTEKHLQKGDDDEIS